MMNNSKAKHGSVGIVLALIITVSILGVLFAYFNGRGVQSEQSEIIASGYQQFLDGDLNEAYQSLSQAREMFGNAINFYRVFAGDEDYFSENDLNELLLSIALAAAHDDFFELKTSDQWVARANEAFELLSESEEKELLRFFVNNVNTISEICELFERGEHEEALRVFFEVEPELVASDEDFLVFQVRFFIAASKEFGEPALLSEARRQLFFATHEVGIVNDRLNQLWVMLTSQ